MNIFVLSQTRRPASKMSEIRNHLFTAASTRNGANDNGRRKTSVGSSEGSVTGLLMQNRDWCDRFI
jgi:hypothetical protein